MCERHSVIPDGVFVKYALFAKAGCNLKNPGKSPFSK